MIDRRSVLAMAASVWMTARAGTADVPVAPHALNRICDLIIPRTDTPGAVDAGVPDFIWSLLNTWHRVDERSRFLADLRQFEVLTLATDVPGPAADADYARALRECQSGSAGEPMQRFFASVQSLVVLGYYTSELGATTELRYDPIPGRFDGSVDYLDIGRQWSS